MKKALESDIANYIVEETLKKQLKTCLVKKIAQGIGNFQIENSFKNIKDTNINDNFVGIFPANRMNRFIDYKSVISYKKGKYPFMIVNTNSSDKGGRYVRY